MGDITILKNDGVFTYSDYGRKAGNRLVELASDGVQLIRRTYGGDVQAALVSKALYDAAMAAAAPDPILTQNITSVADDYLGNNLSEMIDLLLSRVQAPGLESKVASQGTTASAQKTFAIVNSALYYEAEQVEPLPVSGEIEKKGLILGYLITPALHSYLFP